MAELMNVVLASIGSDGDILPYVGLGLKLRERGHRVTLAASQQYEILAKKHGLDFRALHSEKDNHELFSHPDFWHPIKTAAVGAAWGLKRIERHYSILREACLEEKTVLIANPGVLGAMLVHEKHGIPWGNFILQPWLIPSVDAPSVMIGLPVPRWGPAFVVQLYFRFIEVAGDVLIGPKFNKLRASLQLPPIRRILKRWLSPQLIIGGFPAWYAQPQPDWPRQIRLAGFPMFDGAKNAEVPPEVEKFCRAGTAPIAVTFGTEMMHAKRLFQEAIEACRLLGRRAMILTKYKDQLPAPLPEEVLHCSFAPFAKLFPMCAAVVHHGGIGTTSQALAAGVPQLILPFAFDQADNATRVKGMGAGDWIASGRATATRIAHLLPGLINPVLKPHIEAIVREFAHEDGLAKAADYVEELAQFRQSATHCGK
jgi:rhamnosyltransferase subunit B